MQSQLLEQQAPIDHDEIVHRVCECQFDLEEIHSMCGKTANEIEEVFINENACVVCEDLNNYSCQFCGN